LSTAIYNTADTTSSHSGPNASGAVGIDFSIMAIFQAIGFTSGRRRKHDIQKTGAREIEAASMYAPVIFSGLRTA
jgi:hypothetical protein